MLNHFPPQPLAAAEQAGAAFAARVGATSLADLRALPARQLLDSAGKAGTPRFGFTLDGHFFRQLPAATYAAGEQARVPLLVGWNSEESGPDGLMGKEEITVASYTRKVRELYGARADEALRLYPAPTDAAARQAATDLASDRFMGYGTWKWAELHARTSGQPVYRYLFAKPRPPMVPALAGATPGRAGGIDKSTVGSKPQTPARGAVHSAEIEYALGNLATNKVYAWTPDDYQVSGQMLGYFANFVKTGDPSGSLKPKWPAFNGPAGGAPVLRLDVQSRVEPEPHRARYEWLDQVAGK